MLVRKNKKIALWIVFISLVFTPNATASALPTLYQTECAFSGKVANAQAEVKNLHLGCKQVRAGMTYITHTGKRTTNWTRWDKNKISTTVPTTFNRVHYMGQGIRLEHVSAVSYILP